MNNLLWIEDNNLKHFKDAIKLLELRYKMKRETGLRGISEYEVTEKNGNTPAPCTFFALGKIMARLEMTRELEERKKVDI